MTVGKPGIRKNILRIKMKTSPVKLLENISNMEQSKKKRIITLTKILYYKLVLIVILNNSFIG